MKGSKADSKRAEEALALARDTARHLKENLAEEIVILDVHESLGWTRYMILASAQNRTHLATLRKEAAKWVKGRGISTRPEGQDAETDWVLLDLGPVVAHVLTTTGRDYWDLDHLFEGAPRVT